MKVIVVQGKLAGRAGRPKAFGIPVFLGFVSAEYVFPYHHTTRRSGLDELRPARAQRGYDESILAAQWSTRTSTTS